MKIYNFKTWFILLCFAVLTFTVSCSKDDSPEDIEKAEALSVTEEIFQLVNGHRVGIGKEPLAKVAPKAGTLICFESERFPHEVLAAGSTRYSIAGWFRKNNSSASFVDPNQ